MNQTILAVVIGAWVWLLGFTMGYARGFVVGRRGRPRAPP